MASFIRGRWVRRRPSAQRLVAALTAPAGPITGVVDVTEADDTLAATATLLITGTLAVTEEDDTLVATGGSALTGVATVTEDDDTLVATATLAITGVANIIEDDDVLHASDAPVLDIYFAWADEGEAFNAAVHNVRDEVIAGFEINHAEGDFASLKIDVRNPKVGLLAAGRNLWCWLSWNNGADTVALFNGRLIGIPENFHREIVTLEFVARPADFEAERDALYDTLKVLPWHDPLWIAEGAEDPSTVLEARTVLPHVHRTTLAVSVSDMLVGEDGTLDVAADEHVYNDFDVSLGDPPLRRVAVRATSGYTQRGTGTVDLTYRLVTAFQDAGSPVTYPLIGSLTGEGLLADWPKPLDDIGGGWSMAADSSIEVATWHRGLLKTVTWVKPILTETGNVDQDGEFVWINGKGVQWQPKADLTKQVINGYEQWAAVFPMGIFKPAFIVAYDAERKRTETVTFTLTADTQDLLVDASAAEQETIELSSDFADQPVDTGGAIPIVDARRNSYFMTDRGQQSVQNAILRARRKLLVSARAVNITVTTKLAKAANLSLRWNATVHDERLPGGEVTGKVTEYTLRGRAGRFDATITIGCTIGNGTSVSAVAGTGVYVEDGVLADGIQARTGQTIDAGEGDVTYQGFADIVVLDDDGIDLLSMTAASVLNSITLTGGVTAQKAVLNAFDEGYDGDSDPPSELTNTPTEVTVDLKPISGRAFHTDFAPDLSVLVIPKTIDLEAA